MAITCDLVLSSLACVQYSLNTRPHRQTQCTHNQLLAALVVSSKHILHYFIAYLNYLLFLLRLKCCFRCDVFSFYWHCFPVCTLMTWNIWCCPCSIYKNAWRSNQLRICTNCRWQCHARCTSGSSHLPSTQATGDKIDPSVCALRHAAALDLWILPTGVVCDVNFLQCSLYQLEIYFVPSCPCSD